MKDKVPVKIISIILSLTVFYSCAAQHNLHIKVIEVSSEIQLQQALDNAKAGDEIVINRGIYKGNFVIPSTANGTASHPIILRSSGKVVLDGNTILKGYVLHLQANYWILKNFTITNGLKGIIADGANYNLIDSLNVNTIGEEAIHLRRFSCHNSIQHCVISNTGLKTPDYGEGIYLGSAVSNWPKYTNGLEDKSDSNSVIENRIGPDVAAECIDIKEGSTGGIIRGNYFNSKGITGANSADSWIDVKGNGYLIETNTGINPKGSVLQDGYQVHCAVEGWGNDNVFKNNVCEVNASGYGFNVVLKSKNGETKGNKVYKNNVVNSAESGISNIELIR